MNPTEQAFTKFIPFVKIDEAKRQVWGVVTAEVPDKDDEVCDYEKSKPYYKAWSDELKKNTDGLNLGNLREMHQLKVAGVGIDMQLRDASKEIYMGFEVVDDDAWKKVQKRAYTGFSQGGRKVGEPVPDPKYPGCMRYIAKPSEISLVDNPCLPTAHFTVVKADGTTEIEKFEKVESPNYVSVKRFEELEQKFELLKTSTVELSKGGKTKRVAGKDLTSSSFAYVGDADKTETWKLPIHDAAHCRNALARFNQTKGIPAGEKAKVHARIVAACKKFGIDVAGEDKKAAAVRDLVFKAARKFVNASGKKIVSKRVEGTAMLSKNLYHTAGLGNILENLAGICFSIAREQEWEEDENSVVPAMLMANITDLVETFLESANEEARELLEEMRLRLGSEAA